MRVESLSAFERAVRLLARRARTEAELQRALASFPAEERAAALARVRELGYMDDRETARQRARAAVSRGEAPRLMLRRLSAQGIGEADAKAAVAEAGEGAGEEALAARALARKLRGRQVRDERERRRLFRALVAKGHRARAVAKLLGLDWEGGDDTSED